MKKNIYKIIIHLIEMNFNKNTNRLFLYSFSDLINKRHKLDLKQSPNKLLGGFI
ncbi:hypothetical protein XBKB1_2960026 [Xenorhabdus bovienii str. kraussei Becker Underwood]|uniref:Uncharacterized protein n=1 Tax=Xenorhabdus bovienii str. kraussei Becker Underwood TaxID=1398204 RepID=A0A077PUW3_XENBV|nr:hypothetical protein XBKB1_2960026 [Xenorhabdus bovienii str. kraussei Becker Underwood]